MIFGNKLGILVIVGRKFKINPIVFDVNAAQVFVLFFSELHMIDLCLHITCTEQRRQLIVFIIRVWCQVLWHVHFKHICFHARIRHGELPLPVILSPLTRSRFPWTELFLLIIETRDFKIFVLECFFQMSPHFVFNLIPFFAIDIEGLHLVTTAVILIFFAVNLRPDAVTT